MSYVYHYHLDTGEIHIREGVGIPWHIIKELNEKHGNRSAIYWHNKEEWLQWRTDTQRMHIDATDVPAPIRALHLIHSS